MCCIVACHLCQCYGLAVAWILNDGVQVFYVISGWLFGLHADIGDIGYWYGKRLLRIVVPYWLELASLFAADTLPTIHVPTARQAVPSLVCVRSGLVPHGAHLCYVGEILLCYLMTLLLDGEWRSWRLRPIALTAAILLLFGDRIVAGGFGAPTIRWPLASAGSFARELPSGVSTVWPRFAAGEGSA
jgi:hypothetical protein